MRVISFIGILLLSAFCLNVYASQEAAYKHNENGHKYMGQGRFREAIKEFKMAQKYLPSNETLNRNLMIAYNNYGFKLRDQGDLSLAAEQFEHSLHYDPGSAYPYYNLGQTYYLMQDMTRARQNLKKAYRIDPGLKGLKEMLVKVNRETTVEKGYHNMDTMHFLISYSDDTPIDKVSYVKAYLEEAYGRVGMFLDLYPVKKTVAIVYPEVPYNDLLKGSQHWSMSVYDGKIRVPSAKFRYTNQDMVKIIYHEYAHVLVDEIANRRCPNWFSEGVASKAEDFVEPKDRDLIRSYVEKYGLTPIRHISGNLSQIRDIKRATMMYMQSYLIVDFISRRKGNSGIVKILERVGEGTPLIRSIEKLFGESIRSFENKWKLFVIDEYRIDMS